MGTISKTVKYAAIGIGIYFTTTYILNTYFDFKKEGKGYPIPSTIEKMAEDAGDVVKKAGRCTAKVVEYGIKSGEELCDKINDD